MVSIQDVIYEVISIKHKSDELESAIRSDAEQLQRTGTTIASMVDGSNMGNEAVQIISVALRSLSFAEASIRMMSRACDNYVEKIRR